MKEAVFKNFAIFTGKQLCWNLLPVNIAKFLRTSILKNICERLPLFMPRLKELQNCS